MPIFSKVTKKDEKKCKKGLDKRPRGWYNICAKKQNVPRSHPAAKERARLIGQTPPLGVLCCAECMLGALFISPTTVGTGGNFLLAREKRC